MNKRKILIFISTCLLLSIFLLAGCGSKEKKAMKEAIGNANIVLKTAEIPYDQSTLINLQDAVASADKAKDDKVYAEVTQKITSATKAYEDSVKQLKQVTNPSGEFILERVKSLDSITDAEAATEENDKNKMMNKPGGYTALVYMKSSMVDDEYGIYENDSPIEAGNAGGAAIESFTTVEDANARSEYLGLFDSGGGLLNVGTHKVVGTCVIRTSNRLTATQQRELENNIINALIRLD